MAEKTKVLKKEKKPHRKRNTVITLILLLTLYTGAHIFVRTDGMRSCLINKLSEIMQQPVLMEQCGLTPLLSLYLQEVEFPGVNISSVKISFNWLSLLFKEQPFVKQLRNRGMEIQFHRMPSTGDWEPSMLYGLGNHLGATLGLTLAPMETDQLFTRLPSCLVSEKTSLKMERAKIVWHDEEGKESASITEIDFYLNSRSFIKRDVIQIIVECGHVKPASSQALRNFRFEAFCIKEPSRILVIDMAGGNGQKEEFISQNLWQDLGIRFNRLLDTR